MASPRLTSYEAKALSKEYAAVGSSYVIMSANFVLLQGTGKFHTKINLFLSDFKSNPSLEAGILG
jgi:hypothetical protein